MPNIKDPNATIHVIKQKINNLENKFVNSGKYLGSFASLDEALESGIAATATKNDYIFVVRENTRTNFIFNGEKWIPGFTVNIDYLDPSDFCLVLPNSAGTINLQDFNKFKNNLNAIKIYNTYTKTFYHSDYEDDTKYYFVSSKLESSSLLSYYTLEIVKATAAYSTHAKHLNIKLIEDAAIENADNIAAARQVVVGNFGGTSGNLDEFQIQKLLNYTGSGEGEGEEMKKLINPLFVKLWDNSSGLVYQLVLKPINNNFGNWYFTNQRVLGSTLNASIEVQRIVVNITDASTASWTKLTKNIQ